MADAGINDDEIAEIKRWYLDVFDDSNNENTFADKIRKMKDAGQGRLIVSLNDLRLRNNEGENGPAHAKALLQNPVKEIIAMQLALKEQVDTLDASYAKQFNNKFFVGIEGSFGANHVTPRGLSARLLGQMVMVEGIVSKCTLIHPKVVKSVHYCPATEASLERSYRDVTSLDGVPTGAVYPKEDDNGNKLVTEYGLSVYKNHQRITIQEMPERAPTGQLPRSVDAIIDDDLVDSCKAGDRIQIMGIFRAMPSKKGGVTTGVFKTVLLANNVRSLEKGTKAPVLTDKDVRNINKVARGKNGLHPFDLLSQSLAQSIYGNSEIKKGLLCLLLGGEEKNLKRGGHIRGDVNILMVGDPSCGKSQMLRFVQNISQHCLTTTGRGSSGVGLTAAVTTDQDTGERVLEAGAMVLADRGIVCIDEFDKMSDLDRVAIHEVMEQQTVTISKAGIHTSLNARCSVLAAANPVYGRYDPYQTPMENIGLPDSLLSRFDLLFIMLDKMEPETDRKLADHVLRSHTFRKTGETDGQPLEIDSSADVIVTEDPNNVDVRDTPMFATHNVQLKGKRKRNDQKLLSLEFCKKYIMYCKANCHPVLTAEAAGFIAERYAALRSKETDSKSLPVTARTLECMIRLSTAYAKSRLSNTVEQEDAENALTLVNFAYYNEAEKRTRTPEPESDSNDEDDDDNSNDGPSVNSSLETPLRSSQRTPQSKRKRTDDSTPAKIADKKTGDEGKDSKPEDTTLSASVSDYVVSADEPADAIETSQQQQKIVRDCLLSVLKTAQSKGLDGQSTTTKDLGDEVEKLHPGAVTSRELEAVLQLLSDDNTIMTVDDQILLV